MKNTPVVLVTTVLTKACTLWSCGGGWVHVCIQHPAVAVIASPQNPDNRVPEFTRVFSVLIITSC
jgi:hypothetical protein